METTTTLGGSTEAEALRDDVRRRRIPFTDVRVGMVVVPAEEGGAAPLSEVGEVLTVGTTTDGRGTAFIRRLLTGPNAGRRVRAFAWPDERAEAWQYYREN